MSQLGVCGDECNLVRESVKKRLSDQGTETLCFSSDGQYLYHAHRSASPTCPSMDCAIVVDIWNTEGRQCVGSASIAKVSLVPGIAQKVISKPGNHRFMMCWIFSSVSRHSTSGLASCSLDVTTKCPCTNLAMEKSRVLVQFRSRRRSLARS
jgi:hypothetical protein